MKDTHTLANSWNKAEKIDWNWAGLKAVFQNLSEMYFCLVSPLLQPLMFLKQRIGSGLGLWGWAHHGLPRPTKCLQQPSLLCDAAPHYWQGMILCKTESGRNRQSEHADHWWRNWVRNQKTPNKSPGPDSFLEDVFQTYKKELKSILLKLFQKIEVYGIKLTLQGQHYPDS